MTLVVDASVACKWYLDEPFAAQASALVELDELFIAPDLLIAEVGNVVWQRLRRKEIDARQASEIAAHLPGVFVALVPSAALLERAIEIATALDHPAYDCFYLALAERWEAPLVTTDRRLLQIVADTPWDARVASLAAYSARA